MCVPDLQAARRRSSQGLLETSTNDMLFNPDAGTGVFALSEHSPASRVPAQLSMRASRPYSHTVSRHTSGSSLSQAGVAASGGRLLEPRMAATRAAFDALELRGSELSGLERRATRGLDVQPESSASSGGDPAWWMAA